LAIQTTKQYTVVPSYIVLIKQTVGVSKPAT